MRSLILSVFALLFTLSCATSQQSISPETQNSNNSTDPYRTVITGEAQSSKGVIDVHFVGDKVYYEIPDSLLNRDFLMVSRVAAVPSNFFGFISSGSKTAEQVISFEKVRDKINIRHRDLLKLKWLIEQYSSLVKKG